MSALVVTDPVQVRHLGFQNVGREVAIITEDSSARGMLWSLDFRAGEAKVAIKTKTGLLFFNLNPDDTLYVTSGGA